MIRLVSAPTPEALARLDECSSLAREAEDANENPSDAVRKCYRHPAVKSSIVRETSGKCAYCESKITHVYWGDVEHIKPKTRFPELRLKYDNLTFACAICNNNKAEYWSDEAPILDPYADIPVDHLVGLGPLLWHRGGSAQGQRTIDLLDLNRNGLRERRFECIQRLSPLVDRYKREPDGPIKEALAMQLRHETADSNEFALAIRSFLRATCDLQRNAA
jgi:5-methylcytosine-specific restriction endonuclease McrA